jgi:hypothetical protein
MKYILLLCSIFALAACSTVDTSPVQPAQASVESDVVLKAVSPRPGGGTIWEYSSGPKGAWTFLTEFDATGKYVSSRQMRSTP